MAAPAVTFEALRKQIRKGTDLAPVYVLHGEEGYYIDALVKDFEALLPEEDREFNQYVVYAPQTQPGEIMDICRRVPWMSDRQVVIVKEAQAARADQINRLHRYVADPNPLTVLVIVFRGEQAKGKELMAEARKHAVVFESKKVRDYQVGALIPPYVKEKGLSIDVKAQEMLRDYIGADVSRLYNEIDKLAMILPPGAAITPAVIERNIGISKEYNNFELVDALSVKDARKAFSIAEYFASNPKANPLVVTTGTLYGFYSDLLVIYYTPDKSDANLMKVLSLKSAIQLRKYRAGMQHYNAYQVIECIWALRQFDTRSKGIGSRQDQYDLLHDLIFHLITAPGNLGV